MGGLRPPPQNQTRTIRKEIVEIMGGEHKHDRLDQIGSIRLTCPCFFLLVLFVDPCAENLLFLCETNFAHQFFPKTPAKGFFQRTFAHIIFNNKLYCHRYYHHRRSRNVTLCEDRPRRMLKRVVKRRSRLTWNDPLRGSCVSSAQTCGEM